MSEEQRAIFEQTYDWIVNVSIQQKRLLSFEDLWIAYPFKNNGLTKEGFLLVYSIIKKAIN